MSLLEGIVLLRTAGYFDVDVGGRLLRCRMRGRLKKEKLRTDICVIGDHVRISELSENEGVLEEVLPRTRVFSRRHPGKGGQHREDVLVANLDQLFIVFAFRDPPLHPRMLDRFLVIAEHNDIEPLIIANKVDQEEPSQRSIFDRYATIGYDVCFASTVTGAGIAHIRERIRGRVSAFSGPSGAGKSSLLNAIAPDLALRVGETSEWTTKGRHTTRVATLHEVAGGYVADTPGIRELGTWALPDEALDRCFPEMRPYLGECSYRNCAHLAEPDCAVKAAVAAGSILAERYDSYARMIADEER